MFTAHPPSYEIHFMDLPLSRLNVLETGQGRPLIMVPATISELENWRALAQFMAQWFHVYFFELPGHGGSSPFREPFSSHLVARLTGQMVDHLGLDRFNLMGFSFGGILAMRTFGLLSTRVDRLVLIAPCLGWSTLSLSGSRIYLLRTMNQILGRPKIQACFNELLHNPRTISIIVKALQKMGRLEASISLEDKLLRTPASTIAVLNAQINEILTIRFDAAHEKYETPCYLAMSVRDPILRFDTVMEVIRGRFVNVNAVQLAYPYHQPPRPFTFEELNRDFYETVDAFMQIEPATREVPPEMDSSPPTARAG